MLTFDKLMIPRNGIIEKKLKTRLRLVCVMGAHLDDSLSTNNTWTSSLECVSLSPRLVLALAACQCSVDC